MAESKLREMSMDFSVDSDTLAKEAVSNLNLRQPLCVGRIRFRREAPFATRMRI